MAVATSNGTETRARILDGALGCHLHPAVGLVPQRCKVAFHELLTQVQARADRPVDPRHRRQTLIGTVQRRPSAARPGHQIERDRGLVREQAQQVHPLLDRLLATDPDTLLPYLTTRAGPVLARARDVMVELLGSKAWVRASLLEQAADTGARMVLSYVLAPPSRPDQDVARDLAQMITLALTGKEARKEGRSR